MMQCFLGGLVSCSVHIAVLINIWIDTQFCSKWFQELKEEPKVRSICNMVFFYLKMQHLYKVFD